MDGALTHGTDGVIRQLKACLNGKRSQADNPAVPVTPAELARDAAAAVAAGAEAIHLHARGPDGAESVRAADVGAAVAAVRAACPGTPVGVSTGLWITHGDAAVRHTAVAAWKDLDAAARPDFASVNVSEEGWAGVARVLSLAAIAVEAGVWSAADVPVLAAAGLPQPPLRILVEVSGEPAPAAPRAAEAILRALDASAVRGLPRLLHGESESCWPLVAHAAREGLPTRIGLEDTLANPDGEAVRGNAELVRYALEMRAAHRPGPRM
jgi:uncharacterized protein (DUF849 family)